MIYYYSGKHARDTPDACAKDYAMALRFFEEAAPGAGAARGGALLDLGCGDGLMARRFAQSGRFRRVFALDLSRGRLEAARRAAEEERLTPEDGLLLARADALELPLRRGAVDFVWWGLGPHVVRDLPAALRSVFGVLRPGGRLLATTLSEAFMPEELARMATEAGFSELGLRVPRYSVYALQAVRP